MTKNYKVAIKVFDDLRQGNWDTWRKRYEQLDINDLIWINLAIHGVIREQICKTANLFKESLKLVMKQEPALDVIELGCYRGGLAAAVLRAFPKVIRSWIGYDINYHALDNPIVKDKRFKGVKQTDWFFNLDLPSYANLFVSMSTLEHHSNKQFEAILKKVHKSGIKYIIIGLPIDARGWWGSNGSHILTLGQEGVLNIIESVGFELLEKRKGRVYQWAAIRK
jgi:hypothetical protein